MKFLIAGLGNQGSEYVHTRHNIGFDVLDYLAKEAGATFSDGRYGWVASFKLRGRQVICIKPSTYMNLSGNAVRYWMQQEKIAPEHLLVATDDLNLDLGVLRLRAKGSHGGHNGLRHITEVLGSDAFPRLRFGVGNQFEKGRQVDFVLGKWSELEQPTVDASIVKAANAIQTFCTEGLPRAMNVYNG